jgi:dATP/dGTP diphosphohydrolase
MRVSNDFPRVLPVIAAVMERGTRAHQGEDWSALPVGFHLAPARRHLDLAAVGDANEPHLAHAVCRLLVSWKEESTMTPPILGGARYRDEAADVRLR